MRLRPFFQYYGGKYRAAPHYPAPAHPTIVEPFAGSAGYSLRYYERSVILRDVDEAVVGTWDYLLNASPDEVRRLPLYDGTWATVDELNLPQEARWLIGWWLNTGGVAYPRRRPSTRFHSGARPNSHWGPAMRELIATQMPAVRHWRIERGSYDTAPDMPATWFVDPPYELAGKHYRHGSAALDYEELGRWVRARRGQVIACEAVGATWLPFSPHVVAKTMTRSTGSSSMVEAIWHREAAA